MTEPPQVGSHVRLRRDVLAEVSHGTPGALPTWRYLAAGSRGKLIGFRDRDAAAIVDLAGQTRRLVVYVRETSVDLA